MSIIDVFFCGRAIVDIDEFPLYFRAHVKEWFYVEEVKNRAKDPNLCPYECYSDKMGIDYSETMRLIGGDTKNIPTVVLDHMRCGISIEDIRVERTEKKPCLVHLGNARRSGVD